MIEQRPIHGILILDKSLGVTSKGIVFFRSCLASTLRLRVVPRIQFVFDDSVIRGNRMETLISSCVSDA